MKFLIKNIILIFILISIPALVSAEAIYLIYNINSLKIEQILFENPINLSLNPQQALAQSIFSEEILDASEIYFNPYEDTITINDDIIFENIKDNKIICSDTIIINFKIKNSDINLSSLNFYLVPESLSQNNSSLLPSGMILSTSYDENTKTGSVIIKKNLPGNDYLIINTLNKASNFIRIIYDDEK